MEPPARESRMPPPPEHDIDDGGILNQHRQDNFVSLADVRSATRARQRRTPLSPHETTSKTVNS
jgi:hypothetical protein